MSNPTYGPIPFFGIGAMRAGTSWLWDVLKRYPDCHISRLKELHFFDCRYGLNNGRKVLRSKAERLVENATAVRDAITKLRDELSETGRGGRVPGRATADLDDEDEWDWGVEPDTPIFQGDHFRGELFDRLKIGKSVRRTREILEYFSVHDIASYAAFLQRGAEGAAAFGEITPSYALLPAAAFAEIDSAFPGARFIFILRDPVDRLWSQVRYTKARGRRQRGQSASELNETFRQVLRADNPVARSSYSRTINTLESKIPQERILYLFYEKMVSSDTGPAEICRIENFLNLQPRDPASVLEKSKNAGPGIDLDPENRAAALEVLRPEYEFVAQRFGVQEKWTHSG